MTRLAAVDPEALPRARDEARGAHRPALALLDLSGDLVDGAVVGIEAVVQRSG